MHTCANVVCGAEGEAQAVLLRAGEVMHGQEQARLRRTSVRTGRIPPCRDLARGPARLAQALGLTLADYGADLLTGDAVRLRCPGGPLKGSRVEPSRILTGPRVGVRGPGGDGTAYP